MNYVQLIYFLLACSAHREQFNNMNNREKDILGPKPPELLPDNDLLVGVEINPRDIQAQGKGSAGIVDRGIFTISGLRNGVVGEKAPK